jgi:hypothetical protein
MAINGRKITVKWQQNGKKITIDGFDETFNAGQTLKADILN